LSLHIQACKIKIYDHNAWQLSGSGTQTHTHIHTRVHILGGSSSFSVLDEEMLLAVKQVIKKAFCNS